MIEKESSKLIYVIGSLWNDDIEKQLMGLNELFFKRTRETVLMEKVDIRKDLIIAECPCGSIPYYLEVGKKLYQMKENVDKLRKVREMLHDEISR